jgi:hypothetical protein
VVDKAKEDRDRMERNLARQRKVEEDAEKARAEKERKKTKAAVVIQVFHNFCVGERGGLSFESHDVRKQIFPGILEHQLISFTPML